MFTKVYQSLKQGYQRSWLKFLFRNTSLTKLITQTQEPSAFEFFKTYLSSWWWNRWWFRSCIESSEVKYKFDSILECLQYLKENGIFTKDTCFSVVNNESLEPLAGELSILHDAGILTEPNFMLVATHAQPKKLADALSDLQRARILTDENFRLVATHAKPKELADALSDLQRAGILTDENFRLFATHAKPKELADALSYLQQAGILTEANQTLVANHAKPQELACGLSRLQRAGILTKANQTFVAKHAHPYHLGYALSLLQQAGILTEANQTLVANHARPDYLNFALSALQDAMILTDENFRFVANAGDLRKALSVLQEAGILTEQNFRLVATHDYHDELANALFVLKEAVILTEDNRTLVAKHANTCDLGGALCVLKIARILTDENLRLVANHASPKKLAEAFYYLKQAEILTEDYRALVAKHAHPYHLGYALSLLQQARILTEANQTLVANHASPHHLSCALSCLLQALILTEPNFEIVATHAHLNELAGALLCLPPARILTQVNFKELTAPNHAALITNGALDNIWHRIPSYYLTKDNFAKLVTASEADNPMAELLRVRNQILGIQAQAGHAAAFNPGQSIHTASVHHSVSASASRLMASYGAGLNVEEKIKEINTFVMGLDDSSKHAAAKKCIARMTRADYTFIDSSNVSTRQLLALAWVAIHDGTTKCLASVEDAKVLFVEGLYEIQRGYNLDDLGNDFGGEDSPICFAGTFNKLMEKLNGIHLDVEVYYITHAGLGIKFPKVVAEHALRYLNRLANPETATGYLSMKELLDSIKENGLVPIWDNIKSAVKAELWDEFKEAYANNPEYPNFVTMIEHGYHSNAPDLTELYNTLEASPGYRAFLYQLEQRSLEEQKKCLGLLQHSLWTNRHESPAAQNIFIGNMV